MTDAHPLMLFNSLTRQLEQFRPVHEGEARVYTCGPTVYNYPHIGNMRAYVFADVLGRALSFKGYKLTHVINITDVGHLTDDADAGEDKMEKMARQQAQSIWDIARHYTKAYWADIKALNVRQPAKWSVATDYVPQMIEFAKKIADRHCYELDSGLYFDVSTVADYGRLAREDELLGPLRRMSARLKTGKMVADFQSIIVDFLAELRGMNKISPRKKTSALIQLVAPLEFADAAEFEANFPSIAEKFGDFLHEGRIEAVDGKRNAADFAIWRKTPPGEKRQMEWDSPWGKGAPGWHLECSVMSGDLLGFPFDIHTGGIDHREIHHPNEIAQNQAFCCTNGLDVPANSGARVWMHNNFLVERSGKMSKSSGEFLRLQLLIDKGYHPLAYRMMCLQAHYRSELEFSWEGLGAALTRLKRLVMGVEKLRQRAATEPPGQADMSVHQADQRISNDLDTAGVLVIVESIASMNGYGSDRLDAILRMDELLGLNLDNLRRTDLRIRPKTAIITEAEIEATLSARKKARAAKDFATSDRLRDELAAQGVEVMDGDPLGWEWKLGA